MRTSSFFGGIELIHHDDYARRYAVAFSLRDREWRRVTVAWRDLVPETAGAPFLDGKAAKPSSFGNFWVGKWWYWGEYGRQDEVGVIAMNDDQEKVDEAVLALL